MGWTFSTMDRWLGVEEIAGHLGVSKDTVYVWIGGKPGLAPIAEAAWDRDVTCPVLHGLSVDADDTTDWFTGPPGELACMLGAAAARATTPIDADAFARAKREFVGDLEQNAASDGNARLYGEAWALWFPPPKALAALTHADATAHLRALLDPARSALVVVGPVDSDAVLAEGERTLGAWARADAVPVALPAPFAPKPRAPHVGFTAAEATESVEVSMACLVPPAPPPNALPRYVRAVLEASLWRTRHRLAASYGETTLHFWSAYAGHVSAATRVHPARLEATSLLFVDGHTQFARYQDLNHTFLNGSQKINNRDWTASGLSGADLVR